MDKDAILQALTGIVREYFDDDELVLTRDTKAEDVPAWNSLNHVNLIVAVEQRFRIKVLTSEMEHLHDVGALVDLVDRKIKR